MVVAQPHEIVPLDTLPDGTIRVGGTRIPLETVAAAYHAGATAEEICHDFPSLDLADVYAVLMYMLRHPQEVDQYLAQRQSEADELRSTIEASPRYQDFRQRLLERRARSET